MGRQAPTLNEYFQSVCAHGGADEAAAELSEEDFAVSVSNLLLFTPTFEDQPDLMGV